MPSFSLNGKWDRYLSFHLYSGQDGHRYSLIALPSGLKKLPAKFHQYLSAEPGTVPELNAGMWSYEELRIPLVTDDRVMLLWCKSLMRIGFGDDDCFIHHDLPLDTTRGNARYKPSEIRSMSRIPPLPSKAPGISSVPAGE